MANRPHIVVADADPGICRLLRRHLGARDYSVATAETGRKAIDSLRSKPPDLAILSTGLVDFAWIELIRRVRGACRAPIFALMEPHSPLAQSTVLESGADDCIDEPFLLEELIARAERLLQRVDGWQGQRVLAPGLGPIELNRLQRKVRIGGEPVALTRKEFDLLALLVGAGSSTLPHDEIVERIWGRDHFGARQNLRRTVSSLRRKIEPDVARPAHLVSVRGSGYRFSVNATDTPHS
jgi:two-component system KDP operon response regulator KdpE